jgi:hypothetical protein
MAMGEAAVGLHHPQGDLKKLSVGVVADPTSDTGRTVAMSWITGTTEPGSSGSGLFSEKNGQYVLRGALRGGSASCANSGALDDLANRDFYSRLDGEVDAISKLVRSADAPRLDYSDLWAVTSEAANGVTITQRASGAVFVVWFTYDADGSPAWLMMPSGAWTSATSFAGTLYRATRHGTAPTQETIGRVTFEFAAADRGRMEVQLAGQAPRSMDVQRHVF